MKRFIFSIAIMAALLGGCSEEESALMRSSGAIVHCKDLVKKRLKSPSTAKFPWQGEGDVSVVGARYTVNSYVDSHNGFGAMLRTNYTCKLEYLGSDTWRFVDLRTY